MLSVVFNNGQYIPETFSNGKGDKHDFGAGYEDIWYKSNPDNTISVNFYELSKRFNSGYKFPVGESYNHNLIFKC